MTLQSLGPTATHPPHVKSIGKTIPAFIRDENMISSHLAKLWIYYVDYYRSLDAQKWYSNQPLYLYVFSALLPSETWHSLGQIPAFCYLFTLDYILFNYSFLLIKSLALFNFNFTIKKKDNLLFYHNSKMLFDLRAVLGLKRLVHPKMEIICN